MARAIWTGAVSFGLVNVPVGLYSATEDHDVHFHQFEKGTSARVRNQRVNEKTGDEVAYKDVVKGAELSDGGYVMITQEELSPSSPPRAARSTSPTSSRPLRSTRSTTRSPTSWLLRTTVPRRRTRCWSRRWTRPGASAWRRS